MSVSSVLDNPRRILIKTAKELAGADYEDGNYSERFRRIWPKVDTFIARNWPNYIVLAREILTSMLRPECKDVSDKMKEEIYDALQADYAHQLKHPSKVGRGTLNLRPDHPGQREKAIFWDGK